MSRSEYLRNLEKAVKAERASTKNLLTKQGKTMSELLLSETRQKQFAPITSEVKALRAVLAPAQAQAQPILRETTEAVATGRKAVLARAFQVPVAQARQIPAAVAQHAVAQPAVAAAPPVAQQVVAAEAAPAVEAEASSDRPNNSTYFDELESVTENRDRIFGSVAANQNKTSQFRFGLSDVLERSKYIKPVEHKVEYNFVSITLTVNDSSTFELRRQLIEYLLLEDSPELKVNDDYIHRYVEILDACMHENLMFLFFNRKHAGTSKASDAAAPIVAEIFGLKKYALLDTHKHLIKESDARLTRKKKEGKGFNDLIGQQIASYAGSDRLVKRAMVLLASARAGNSSRDILREYTAVLDELLDQNKLDTFTYKLFLKKMLFYLKKLKSST